MKVGKNALQDPSREGSKSIRCKNSCVWAHKIVHDCKKEGAIKDVIKIVPVMSAGVVVVECHCRCRCRCHCRDDFRSK